MTTLVDLLNTGLAHRVGWVLAHFLWQGAAIAGLLWLALRLLARRGPQVRYAVACLALLLMVAAPVVTFFVVQPAAQDLVRPVQTSGATYLEDDSWGKGTPLKVPTEFREGTATLEQAKAWCRALVVGGCLGDGQVIHLEQRELVPGGEQAVVVFDPSCGGSGGPGPQLIFSRTPKGLRFLGDLSGSWRAVPPDAHGRPRLVSYWRHGGGEGTASLIVLTSRGFVPVARTGASGDDGAADEQRRTWRTLFEEPVSQAILATAFGEKATVAAVASQPAATQQAGPQQHSKLNVPDDMRISIIAASPDGQHFLLGYSTRKSFVRESAKLFDSYTGKLVEIDDILKEASPTWPLRYKPSFSPDSKHLLVVVENKQRLMQLYSIALDTLAAVKLGAYSPKELSGLGVQHWMGEKVLVTKHQRYKQTSTYTPVVEVWLADGRLVGVMKECMTVGMASERGNMMVARGVLPKFAILWDSKTGKLLEKRHARVGLALVDEMGKVVRDLSGFAGLSLLSPSGTFMGGLTKDEDGKTSVWRVASLDGKTDRRIEYGFPADARAQAVAVTDAGDLVVCLYRPSAEAEIVRLGLNGKRTVIGTSISAPVISGGVAHCLILQDGNTAIIKSVPITPCRTTGI